MPVRTYQKVDTGSLTCATMLVRDVHTNPGNCICSPLQQLTGHQLHVNICLQLATGPQLHVHICLQLATGHQLHVHICSQLATGHQLRPCSHLFTETGHQLRVHICSHLATGHQLRVHICSQLATNHKLHVHNCATKTLLSADLLKVGFNFYIVQVQEQTVYLANERIVDCDKI